MWALRRFLSTTRKNGKNNDDPTFSANSFDENAAKMKGHKMYSYNLAEFCERVGRVVEHEEFVDKLKSLWLPEKEGPWVAGSALRRLISGIPQTSDTDYFFGSEQQRGKWENAMKAKGLKEKSRVEKVNVTFEGAACGLIQGIYLRYYNDPAAVINSFDYTICQLAYDGVNLIVGPYTLWDLARKRLAVHQISHGVSSIRRLLKYERQGYTVCSGTIHKILTEISARERSGSRRCSHQRN